MRRFLRNLKGQSGQGMSEYLIIVALIAVAAIGVVTVFGTDIRDLFAASSNSLAGNQTANNAPAAAATQNARTLKNFGQTSRTTGN
jgi:pilus assembly protein Flp/PilA